MSTRPATMVDCLEAKQQRLKLERESAEQRNADYQKRTVDFENSKCSNEVISSINNFLKSKEMDGLYSSHNKTSYGVLTLPSCVMDYTDMKYEAGYRHLRTRLPIIENFVTRHYSFFENEVALAYSTSKSANLIMYFDTKTLQQHK